MRKKYKVNKKLQIGHLLSMQVIVLLVAALCSCGATGPITGKGYLLPDPCYDAEMYAVRNRDRLTPAQVGLLCECQPYTGMSEADFYTIWTCCGDESRGTTLFGQPYVSRFTSDYSVTFINGRVADFTGYR